MRSWSGFFKFVGVAMPVRAKFVEMLRNGVRNSRRRGYHKDGMDFNRLHASGASQILRKGESYLAAATLNEIDLQEHWSWDSGDVKYLDATCLLYDSQHQRLGHLDYNNMTFVRADSTSLSPSVLSHSGDQLDHCKESGFHQIGAQLNSLPKDIRYLYITVSSWAGARLRDIRQPSVRLSERGGQELCRYNVESADGDKTAILMCVLHRRVDRSTSAVSRWALEAIGEVGLGSADNYGPIYDSIDKFRKTKKL
jgi:stress response protein SCP2